ncbi:p53 and DNA damage-regulated protein 1 isoform X1 [Xiphophorus couchianus]|uniref:p53 and DNA damage-regulated protein 1 isoform X1 n=1 Tax=Xiphophorus couchianus TaxID=32473 RepID=UPI001015FCEE|nr:p53 and DNA damage-regulated protein 1 isoform X1 [Xiphophorus couchianus]
MDAGSQRVLQYLTEVEEAAEDVLTTKQQVPETRGDATRTRLSQRTEVDSLLLLVLIVDLDMKRNRNREALSALKHDMADTEKVKVCFGNMFLKFPKSKAREMIQKDQEQLDKEISDLRRSLKAKVNCLNEMQGNPELRGYNLSPLSAEELKAINSLLRR